MVSKLLVIPLQEPTGPSKGMGMILEGKKEQHNSKKTQQPNTHVHGERVRLRKNAGLSEFATSGSYPCSCSHVLNRTWGAKPKLGAGDELACELELDE